MAKNVVYSSDALSESVSHDIDIYMTGKEFDAQNQGVAFACATVLHMAMKQIRGRDGGQPGFEKLKDEIISEFGRKPTSIRVVLEKYCLKYRLRYREATIQEAKKAISEKRPVIACFKLPSKKMLALKKYRGKCDGNSTGILTKKNLDIPTRPSDPVYGHAVVLTSYNSKSLTFMNSWGAKWADDGFFSVENTEVFERMKFYDVYWNLDDLSEEEEESYRKSDSEVAVKLSS